MENTNKRPTVKLALPRHAATLPSARSTGNGLARLAQGSLLLEPGAVLVSCGMLVVEAWTLPHHSSCLMETEGYAQRESYCSAESRDGCRARSRFAECRVCAFCACGARFEANRVDHGVARWDCFVLLDSVKRSTRCCGEKTWSPDWPMLQ